MAFVGREGADSFSRDVADRRVPPRLLVFGVFVDQSPGRRSAVEFADEVSGQMRPRVRRGRGEPRPDPVLGLNLDRRVGALEPIGIADYLDVIDVAELVWRRPAGREIDASAVLVLVVPIEEVGSHGSC